MVDPLEYLIGFYSVVGRVAPPTLEAGPSVKSQGAANQQTVRNSGVASVICVRSSGEKVTTSGSHNTARKTVGKRATNNH